MHYGYTDMTNKYTFFPIPLGDPLSRQLVGVDEDGHDVLRTQAGVLALELLHLHQRVWRGGVCATLHRAFLFLGMSVTLSSGILIKLPMMTGWPVLWALTAT